MGTTESSQELEGSKRNITRNQNEPIEFLGPIRFSELPDPLFSSIPSGTTPSVSNIQLGKLLNTTPTSVTNFLGGMEGQHLFLVGDGNTTFVHGTFIATTTGADKLTTANTVYLFILDGNVWREFGSAGGGGLSDGDKGDVIVSSGGTVWTVDTNAVTNGKLAQIPANRIKGNNTGALANAIDLTEAEVTAMLDIFTPTLQGLVPPSAGGTSNFLRADGIFAAPPGGGGGLTLVQAHYLIHSRQSRI